MVKTVVFEEEFINLLVKDVKGFMSKHGTHGNFRFSEDATNPKSPKSLIVTWGEKEGVDCDLEYFEAEEMFRDYFNNKYGVILWFDFRGVTEHMIKNEIEVSYYSKITLN